MRSSPPFLPSFLPLVAYQVGKNDHFAKTGSGQTQRNACLLKTAVYAAFIYMKLGRAGAGGSINADSGAAGASTPLLLDGGGRSGGGRDATWYASAALVSFLLFSDMRAVVS